MATLSGTANYCVYYVMMDYWKTILSNHPSIGFVSQGDIFSLDTKEFPQYPLANINVDTLDITDKIATYNFTLILADKPKVITPDSIDNTNKQIIPYDGISDLQDIELGNIKAAQFLDKFDNVLAGWTINFDISVPNNCFNYCTVNLNP